MLHRRDATEESVANPWEGSSWELQSQLPGVHTLQVLEQVSNQLIPFDFKPKGQLT